MKKHGTEEPIVRMVNAQHVSSQHYEEFCLLEKTNQPANQLKFRGILFFNLQGKVLLTNSFMLVFTSDSFSNLKMEVMCSPETCVQFQVITLCSIPEESPLCEPQGLRLSI
jgi:hypothetical protein